MCLIVLETFSGDELLTACIGKESELLDGFAPSPFAFWEEPLVLKLGFCVWLASFSLLEPTGFGKERNQLEGFVGV